MPLSHLAAATKLLPLSEYTFLRPTPSSYESFEAHDKILSGLVIQQLQVYGSGQATCEQQNVGFSVSSVGTDLV